MIERWNYDRHAPLLSEWLMLHGLAQSAGSAGLYPPSGFVVSGVAMGFLYATNAPLVAYLDGVVCSPHAPKRELYLAANQLCAALLDEADSLGVKLVYALTDKVGLLSICKRHGFVQYGGSFRCLVKGAL